MHAARHGAIRGGGSAERGRRSRRWLISSLPSRHLRQHVVTEPQIALLRQLSLADLRRDRHLQQRHELLGVVQQLGELAAGHRDEPALVTLHEDSVDARVTFVPLQRHPLCCNVSSLAKLVYD